MSTDEYVNDDLSAVFMPYYPKDQLGKEVSAIRNVTRFRTLDNRKFSRADNPYCIFCAVYNFGTRTNVAGSGSSVSQSSLQWRQSADAC